MNFLDLILISLGNLWRMKLRTFLTMSGVVIAIAAFVSMLSFGAGMQEMITEQFNQLGLFNTMVVYEKGAVIRHDDEANENDTTKFVPLDNQAIEQFSKISGVILAYPFDAFDVELTLGDSTVRTQAQALPKQALETKLFSNLEAGEKISSDSLKEVLVTDVLVEMFGLDSAVELLDQQIIVSAKASSIDSALINIIKNENYNIIDRVKEIDTDSIFDTEYRNRILKTEANNAIKRFVEGYTSKQLTVADTLIIKGVLKGRDRGRTSAKPVIIPLSTARLFKEKNAGAGDPADLFSLLKGGGNFFEISGDEKTENYSKVTIDLKSNAIHSTISDSIKTMGFRTFSYAEEFDEIRKVLTYFNMGLGIIGLIALITASLGIVNTMVFSIIERRKEIGVLKSLGADELHIKGLFLVESSLIGALGASLGIVFGWVITRIVSLVVTYFMEKEGVDPVELFALPVWLILSSFVVGILVSLLAGYFPSARAARIDPVEALRNE